MQTIITAMANPTLNNLLKESNKYSIPIKDLTCQDDLLEYLKENKEIKNIVLSEILSGNYDKYKFIKELVCLTQNINVIIILEKEDINFEKFLNENRNILHFL